jgi:hypothetical protein
MSEPVVTSTTHSAAGVPIGIFLDIDWGSPVAAKLLSASIRMQRWDILLRTIGRKYVTSIRKNFDDQSGPDGRWPGLKRPRGKGHNPLGMVLQDTYKLIDSVGYAPADPIDTLRIGYGMAYGRFHQSGTRFMPRRRFLWVREADQPGPEIQRFIQTSFSDAAASPVAQESVSR